MSDPTRKDAFDEQHFDTRQLAKRWQLSSKSIARLRQNGNGPNYLRIQGRILYRVNDVISYEKKHLFSAVGQRLSLNEGDSSCP